METVIPSRMHEADKPGEVVPSLSFAHLYLPDTFDGRPVTVLLSDSDYEAIIDRYGTLSYDTWLAYKQGRQLGRKPGRVGKKDSK